MDVRVVYSSCANVSGPVLNACLKRQGAKKKPSRSLFSKFLCDRYRSIDEYNGTGKTRFHLCPLYVTVDTGATTTAVPVQNTSSASIRSSMETSRSSTCSIGTVRIIVVSNNKLPLVEIVLVPWCVRARCTNGRGGQVTREKGEETGSGP